MSYQAGSKMFRFNVEAFPLNDLTLIVGNRPI